MSKPLAWSAVMLTVLAGAAFAQTPPADLDAALKKLTTPAPAAPSKAVELPAQFKTEAPAADGPGGWKAGPRPWLPETGFGG